MFQTLKKKGERYGGYMELWNPIFFPVDLDLIKNIMIKDFDHFSDHRGFATEIDPHLYWNLFNLKGEPWKDLRVKMTPAFTTGKMRRMENILNDSAGKLAHTLNTHLSSSTSKIVEIRPYLQHVTFDLIANSVFGVQTDIFDNPQNSTFKRMGDKILQTFTGSNIIKLSILTLFPKFAKFCKLKMLDKDTDVFFTKIVRNIVAMRKSDKNNCPPDFLQTMLEAQAAFNSNVERNESTFTFDEKVLVAQCVVFILGGFDTVDALLSWAVYELALNPSIQEKFYGDIKKAVDGNEGKFTFDMVVNDLVYLDQIVQETLRKYPPPPRIDRQVTKPYKVPDSDLVLPKGTVVMVPIYAVHHDPDVYPEPERFIPERFTKENMAARHISSFLSFGAGPRSCIGNRFALAEAKFVLAHLILNFKLEPCQRTNIPPLFTGGGVMKPVHLVPLQVTKRQL